MSSSNIEDIIGSLYDMVQDARTMPLAADKCILERDRVLDMLDEVIAQMPGELKQSRTIVESRNELINQARREAEGILRQAQQQAQSATEAAPVEQPVQQVQQPAPQPQPQPVYQQPVYQQPMYQQPVYQQPYYQQPPYGYQQQPQYYQQPLQQPQQPQGDDEIKLVQGERIAIAPNCPAYEMIEVNGVYHLYIDLPGVKKSELKMNFSGGSLYVSGHRELMCEKYRPKGKGKGNKGKKPQYEALIGVGRHLLGDFSFPFYFPKPVDTSPDSFKANLADGILHIEMKVAGADTGISIGLG